MSEGFSAHLGAFNDDVIETSLKAPPRSVISRESTQESFSLCNQIAMRMKLATQLGGDVLHFALHHPITANNCASRSFQRDRKQQP